MSFAASSSAQATLPSVTVRSEAETAQLGAALAALLRPGDVLLLEGPLGAGKTSLARQVIRTLIGAPITVPSPTFTLLQPYETARGTVQHVDLYRLSDPDEVLELAFLDQVPETITLVEWPARLGPHRPSGALQITLHPTGDGEGRTITLDGGPLWVDRLSTLATLAGSS